MKILIFTTNYPLLDGGIAPYSFELAQGLTRAGHDVLILTQTFTEKDAKFDQKHKIPTIRVRRHTNRYLELIQLCYHFVKVLIRFRPNLIFPTAWLPCGLIVYPFAKLFGIRMVITAYALEVIAPQRRFWTKIIMKSVLNASFHLIAISRYTRDQLLKLGIKTKNITVFPMGIDPDNFPETDITPLISKYNLAGKQVILTLARLVERKGQDIVLQAMPQVLSRFPDVIYVIAGKGPDEARLRNLARTLNIEQHVLFTGYVDDAEIAQHYQLCDIYVMPSRIIKEKGDAEGFGITFLEANLLEKPVIGGRSGGVVDAIEDGVSGILVDPNSVNEVAAAIIKLLADSDLRRTLGTDGRKRAIEKYNWQKIIDAHADLLQSLM